MPDVTIAPGLGVVLRDPSRGHTVIPSPSRLTRLHYFDGKFLRADDLALEQRYQRLLAALGNQAGGAAGIAHGYDCALEGGLLRLGPGLALDGIGRVLDLPETIRVDIAALLEASRQPSNQGRVVPQARFAGAFAECEAGADTPPDDLLEDGQLYIVTIGHAEAFCGEEDVYGKLCETACVDSTERPFTLEGIVLRAVPWPMPLPLPASAAVALDRLHLRSRVASVYFEAERRASGRASLISRTGLDSEAWCRGALAAGGRDVPVGLLARAGDTTVFLDPWTPRRERMETPPRHSWAWRMAMRPWNAFLAQVLQFQCQLRDALSATPPDGNPDPCADVRGVAGEASETMGVLIQYLGTLAESFAGADVAGVAAGDVVAGDLRGDGGVGSLAAAPPFPGGITALRALEARLRAAEGFGSTPRKDRILIDRGIVELPSAGYLPVVAEGDVTVNAQVRALVGPGVDLRFCVVRHDYVPHALEEAQHMERISLLVGLDDPNARPEVDILVPDGLIDERTIRPDGLAFEATLTFDSLDGEIRGVGRGEAHAAGGAALHFAGATQARGARRFFGATGFSAAPAAAASPEGAAAPPEGAAASPEADADELATTISDLRGAVRAADNRAASRPLDEVVTAERFAVEDLLGTRTTLRRTTPIEPDLIRRVATVATEAARHTANLRTARVMRALDDAVLVRPDRFAVASPDDEGAPLIALWATMSTARNPFKLVAGDTTVTELSLALAEQGPPLESTELRLQGTLRVDTVEASSDRVEVLGRFNGTTYSRETGNGDDEPEVEAIELGVELLWRRHPNGSQDVVLSLTFDRRGDGKVDASGNPISVTTSQPGSLVATVAWEGEPLVAGGRIIPSKGKDPLVLGKAYANPEVLDPNNAVHALAVGALDIIGASLGDERFADVARRKLFPPLPPAEQSLEVRATRGWVLFHRRRRKNCGEESPVKPSAPPRTFQLYHVEAANLDEVERILEILAGGGAGDILTPFAQAQFAAQASTLVSNPDDLRADWQGVVSPDARLIHRAIGAAGDAAGEGETLALARLARIDGALVPVTPLHPDARFETLPQVPPALVMPGLDGVVALITVRAAAPACQTIFRITRENHPMVLDRVLAGDLDGVVADGLAIRLVDVGFDTDNAPIGDALETTVEQWHQQGFDPPILASRVVNLAAPGDDLSAAHTAVVLQHFDGIQQSEGLETSALPTGSCDSLLFLVASPVLI